MYWTRRLSRAFSALSNKPRLDAFHPQREFSLKYSSVCRGARLLPDCKTKFLRASSGKGALLRPPCPGLLQSARTFALTSSRPSPTPVALWIFRNILTVVVMFLGYRTRVARLTPGITGKKRLQFLVSVMGALLTSIMFGTAAFYLTHLSTSPITKRRKFVAFTNNQMIDMIDFELKIIQLEFGSYFLSEDDPVFQRVHNVVSRILVSNKDIQEVRERTWNLIIVDMPEIRNAFILPNGNVYVFTGILEICESDNEIGFVIAHELSHAILEHLAEQMSHMYLGELLFLFPVALIWSYFPLTRAVLTHIIARCCADLVFHLPFSRFSEIEADAVGLQMAAKACLDVRDAVVFWHKMMLSSKEYIPFRHRFEWLSTHPSYATRSYNLEGNIPAALKIRDQCNCPPLPDVDPRPINPALLEHKSCSRENHKLVKNL